MSSLTNNEIILNLLQERCCTKRKDYTGDISLSYYSYFIILYYDREEKNKNNLDTINSVINIILDDCEIYYNMIESKALDALSELSNWASFYVIERGAIYNRICDLIRKIQTAYPINSQNEFFNDLNL